jgi:hypothetical protein
MNMSGRRILKTTAAVVGISALGALGSGTAFAATSSHQGIAPTTHGASTADATDLASPSSSKSGDLHTFAVPKMDTHTAAPSYRYDDNNDYNDDSDNNSGYRYNNDRYNDDSDYRYNDYNNDDDYGYGRYRNRDNGLLGGGLLGNDN